MKYLARKRCTSQVIYDLREIAFCLVRCTSPCLFEDHARRVVNPGERRTPGRGRSIRHWTGSHPHQIDPPIGVTTHSVRLSRRTIAFHMRTPTWCRHRAADSRSPTCCPAPAPSGPPSPAVCSVLCRADVFSDDFPTASPAPRPSRSAPRPGPPTPRPGRAAAPPSAPDLLGLRRPTLRLGRPEPVATTKIAAIATRDRASRSTSTTRVQPGTPCGYGQTGSSPTPASSTAAPLHVAAAGLVRHVGARRNAQSRSRSALKTS